MGKNNARLPNLQPYIAAGIDPKTKLPIRAIEEFRKEGVKKTLRILDEQNAINRYKWYNLPGQITSQELERLLYYKGQICFFYSKELDEFYFMPYALDGTIDFYGRFNRIHPIPMTAGTTETSTTKKSAQEEYLSTLKLRVLYDVPLELVDPAEVCVLLHDYSKQLSQTIIPRQQLQEPILDVMSDCIPFMRTALLNSTGVQGMRVGNEDESANVYDASKALDNAALQGQKWLPIQGGLEFQELTGGATLKSEEFMLAMQSLDNYRLSLYGLDNGGLFQKKSHMLEAEQELNAGNTNLILQDGLSIRQHFCDIVNSYTGLGIWCDLSETVIAADINGDGVIADEEDQSGESYGEQDLMG